MTTATILDELRDPRTRLMRLSVDQYHRMIAAGILAEGAPFELIHGNLIRKDRSAAGGDPMTVGHAHALAVNKLARLSRTFETLGAFVQTQQPITLPPASEPEPDGAVVIGRVEDYSERLPIAADVTCVIEVADASLRRDRKTKRRPYERAGIGTYLIVNLIDRQVELYARDAADPSRFGEPTIIVEPAAVPFPGPRGTVVDVPVGQLLP